jgi:tRNA(adenine34) deaminase
MTDEHFMQQALKEARKAFDEDEVPVGAVIVMDSKIIARGHNQTERLTDPTAHAEIIALTSAFNFLGSKYLPEATIYITVEPCLMCAGALYWSKIGRIVYGADDEKNGYRKMIAPGHAPNVQPPATPFPFPGAAGAAAPQDPAPDPRPFHPRTALLTGVLKEECALLMTSFFRARRS